MEGLSQTGLPCHISNSYSFVLYSVWYFGGHLVFQAILPFKIFFLPPLASLSPRLESCCVAGVWLLYPQPDYLSNNSQTWSSYGDSLCSDLPPGMCTFLYLKRSLDMCIYLALPCLQPSSTQPPA